MGFFRALSLRKRIQKDQQLDSALEKMRGTIGQIEELQVALRDIALDVHSKKSQSEKAAEIVESGKSVKDALPDDTMRSATLADSFARLKETT